MPGSYKLDLVRRIVFSRAWGVLVDTELAAHPLALRDDPRFDPGFKQMADFRDVTEFKLTAEGIRNQAHLNIFAPDSRRALIVGSDVGYGLAPIYQSSLPGNDDPLRIVHTLEDAFDWIGLHRSTLWPDGPADALFGVNDLRGSTAR